MLTENEVRSEVISAPVGAHITRPDTRIEQGEGWYRVTTPSAKSNSLNEVVYSVIEEADVDRIVDETIADYRRIAVPFKWITGLRSAPDNLADLLHARGLGVWDGWGMIASPGLEINTPDENVRIEEVDGTRLTEYCRTVAEGLETDFDQVLVDHQQLMNQPNRRHRFFLAFHQGVPAGAAGYVLHPTSAYLVGAVVLPSFRGKGIYRSLIHARLHDIQRRGVALATTHARAHTSGPILKRLGFRQVLTYKVHAGR